MTFDAFIEKYLGKKIDFDNAYGGQCVDLFRQYVKEVLNQPQPKGVSGAADFWTNFDTDPNLNKYFDKFENTLTGVPNNGDVVLWNKKAGGGFGHVDVFIEGDTKGFIGFDQNWPTLSVCTKTKHDYTNVYGWLRCKQTPPLVSIPTEDVNKLKADLTACETTNEENLQRIVDARKERDDALVTVTSLETEKTNLLEKVALTQQVCQNQITDQKNAITQGFVDISTVAGVEVKDFPGVVILVQQLKDNKSVKDIPTTDLWSELLNRILRK